MIKDLYNRLEVEEIIKPISLSTDDTTDEGEVEVNDYRRVAIVVAAGNITAGETSVTIEGDLDDGEGFSAISDDDLIGDFDDMDDDVDGLVQKVGLKKSYDKIKITLDHSGTTGELAAYALMAKKYDEPV